MFEVVIVEPYELSPTLASTAETLVREAFGVNFRSHDWAHGLDGVHVLVADSGVLIAHASVVPRVLWHSGDQFDTGYVEGVAVRGDQQGRGVGRVVMDHAENIIRERHHIGALNAIATAASFYADRGWQRWIGPTAAQHSTGTIVDTTNTDDCLFVLHVRAQTAAWTPTNPVTCDWRAGDLW